MIYFVESVSRKESNMKNGILSFIALLSILIGCGSGSDQRDIVNGNTPEEQLSEDIASAELGQSEEALNIGNGGYGFTNASSQLRCAQPGVSGQVCFASAMRRIAGYCFTGSPALDNTSKTIIDAAMQNLNSQTNWHFSQVSFPCDIIFQRSTDTSGSTSANIENFMTAAPTGNVVSLTSPAGVTHVNGTWKSFDGLSVVLKLDKLSIVSAPAVAQQVLRHMAGHAGALYMGLGTQQDPSSPALLSPTRRLVNLSNTTAPSTLTAGEVCRANNESVGTPNQISAVFGCGF